MITGPELLIIILAWILLFGGAAALVYYMERRKIQRHFRRLEMDKRMDQNRKQIISDLLRY